MLAISSARPATPADTDYDLLQAKAFESWLTLFNEIIYVQGSGSDDHYWGKKVKIIITEDCPTIQYLASIAAESEETYVVILNADIVLNEEIKLVESLMGKAGCRCATSRRWNFSGDTNHAKLIPGDNGLDIFIATPEAWSYVANQIPRGLRIGIPGWDNWLVQCLHRRYGHSFRNFTRWKCVFHPIHPTHERKFNHDVRIEEELPHIKEL